MATIGLLRAFRGNGCLFMKNSLLHQRLPANLQNSLITKHFSLTPVASSNAVIEFFRARNFRAKRGPFRPEEKRGDHAMMASTHWKIERLLAISMLGVMPACLFVQGPIMDTLLSITVLLHGFWGVDGVLTDYLEKFVPWIHYPWYLITIAGLAGLFYFNYNDVGVCEAIRMVWRM